MLRWIITLAGLTALLASCGQMDTSSGGNLDFTFARQAIDGPCPESPTSSATPPNLDRLDITLFTQDGLEHYSKSLSVTSGQAPKAGGISEGENLTLQVIGYEGGSAAWSGAASGINILAGKSSSASVFMTPIGDISCAQQPLVFPRAFLSAAAMGDGRFLLIGGVDNTVADFCGADCDLMTASASVDIFDPGTGMIYPTTKLNTPRTLATATALPNGTVLVVGGASRVSADIATGLPLTVNQADLIKTFEIYLPAEKLWIEKPMPVGFVFHSATSLGDGRVLLVGGGVGFGTDQASESAYMFDPAAGESVGTMVKVQSNMASPRFGHAAVLTASGSVLIVGGATYPTAPIIEEFTPSAEGGVFASKGFAGSPGNLFFHDAKIIPLRPDEILVAGGSFFDGDDSLNAPLNTNVRILSQISTPEIQSTEGPAMTEPHLMHFLTTTADNHLVIAGGFIDLLLTPGQTVEAFDPTTSALSNPTNLSISRGGHVTLRVTGGRALIAGGLGPDGLLGSAELFTPAMGP
ncbi:MAG: hypothetical protein JRJ87_07540 [Deltaproteobacteria bacterium]|nr:hypothetical protein [Deltaproteobacteria bacterium]